MITDNILYLHESSIYSIYFQYYSIMIKQYSTAVQACYKAPEIEIIEATVESGFATSWGDGSISDEQGNYNYWDNL